MEAIKEDRVLDARGLLCPMPVVKTGKEIKSMENDQVLKVIATDRGSLADMPAWAEDTGHELISHTEENGEYVFLIRKRAEA